MKSNIKKVVKAFLFNLTFIPKQLSTSLIITLSFCIIQHPLFEYLMIVQAENYYCKKFYSIYYITNNYFNSECLSFIYCSKSY